MNHVRLRGALAASLAALLVTACGSGGGADGSSTTGSDQATTSGAPATSTAGPSSTAATTVVPESDLTAAVSRAKGFVAALGSGDVKQAATFVGPVSVQRAKAAGGLDSLLGESTEGYGAWASATDKTVTPFGIDNGLVVVMLEGTVQIEGASEHRVAVLPVRRAESAEAWLVEPWAYDLGGAPPIQIVAPAVHNGQEAQIDLNVPLPVTVRTSGDGEVDVSFDGTAPVTAHATASQPVTVTARRAGTFSVVAVYRAGSDVAATGFIGNGSQVGRPTTPADYASAAFEAWRQGEGARLRYLASDQAYQVLRGRPPASDDNWSNQPRCEGAAGSTYCEWTGDHGNLTLRVGNEAASSGQVALIEARFGS